MHFQYFEALGEFLDILSEDANLRCSNKLAIGTTTLKMHWICPYILSILLLNNFYTIYHLDTRLLNIYFNILKN